MNIKRILCPIDFSEFNHAANEYASMLAESTGAQIIYMFTFLPDVYQIPPAFFDADKIEKEHIEQMKEFIKPTNPEVEASYVLEFGVAAEQIVNYANENNIDLVVMGTHGRTGLRRALMGSVAEAVVRRAECPVLAIKSDNKVPAKA